MRWPSSPKSCRSSPRARIRFAMAGAAVAAVAVGVLAIGLYLVWGRSGDSGAAGSVQLAANPPAQSIAAGAEEHEPRKLHTDVGQLLTAKMPDGSSISLNTNTTLTVHYSKDQRLVVLEAGEALVQRRARHGATVPRAGGRAHRPGSGHRVQCSPGARHPDVRVSVTEGVVKVIERPDERREDLFVRGGPARRDRRQRARASGESIRRVSMRPRPGNAAY